MDEVPTCYCTLLDRKSQSKFICYTRRTDGLFAVCLTDAADVWSSGFTEDSSEQFRQRFALRSTEDFIPKLRSGCVSGSVSVEVNGSSAELHVGSPPGAPSVILSRLEGPQASRELKELLFRMADSLTQPDSKCASPSTTPVKNHQRWPVEPRQQQNCSPSMTAKKRLPGASLINPGTKRKLQATGVAFDDADED